MSDMRKWLNDSKNEGFDVYMRVSKSLLAQIKFSHIDTTHPELFFTLLKDFLDYAHKVEQVHGKPTTELVDEAYQCGYTFSDAIVSQVQSYWGVGNDRMSRPGYAEQIECWASESEWKKTFLTLAFTRGFHLWVKKQVEVDVRLVREKEGRLMLDYALRPYRNAWHRVVENPKLNIELISLILLQGADPNDSFEGTTVWGIFLRRLDGNCSDEGTCDIDSLLETTILLLRHGADWDLDVNKGFEIGCSITPLQVLRAAFGKKKIPEFEAARRQYRSREICSLLGRFINTIRCF